MRGLGAGPSPAQIQAETERMRIRNARMATEARVAQANKGVWSRWAPLIILGGVAAVGLVVFAIKSRKKGRGA